MRLPPWFETWPVSSTAETLTDSSCCRNGISKCLPVDTFLIAHNIYFTLVCCISSICLNWKTFSTCSHSQFPMVWSSTLIDWSIWSHWPLLLTCHLKDSLRGALQLHAECHAIPPLTSPMCTGAPQLHTSRQFNNKDVPCPCLWTLTGFPTLEHCQLLFVGTHNQSWRHSCCELKTRSLHGGHLFCSWATQASQQREFIDIGKVIMSTYTLLALQKWLQR